jgi:epoxyqueuosine reductase QueG
MNTVDHQLTKEIKDFCRQVLRLDICGIGGVERFAATPEGHRPEQLLPGALSVLSIGLPILPASYDWDRRLEGSSLYPEFEIVASKNTVPAARQETVVHIRNEIGTGAYRALYDLVSERLDVLTYEIGRYLLMKGYNVLWYQTSSPIMVSLAKTGGDTWRKRYLVSPFSQAIAGLMSGLGNLGINHCLLTETYGPRLRLNSIITDAPLAPDPVIENPLCIECGKCVKACPVGALGEVQTEIHGSMSVKMAQMNKQKCLASRSIYHQELTQDNLFVNTQNCDCGGICVKVCPVGKARKPRPLSGS